MTLKPQCLINHSLRFAKFVFQPTISIHLRSPTHFLFAAPPPQKKRAASHPLFLPETKEVHDARHSDTPQGALYLRERALINSRGGGVPYIRRGKIPRPRTGARFDPRTTGGLGTEGFEKASRKNGWWLGGENVGCCCFYFLSPYASAGWKGGYVLAYVHVRVCVCKLPRITHPLRWYS